jgi:rubredoxin
MRKSIVLNKGVNKVTMKRYMCLLCGYIYDEAQGSPNEGIVPGTVWDQIPITWRCPDCGAMKEDFEMIEI